MSEQTVKLLEARILLAVERMRELAAERASLMSEVERLRGEWTAWSEMNGGRTQAAREALRHALAEMREE